MGMGGSVLANAVVNIVAHTAGFTSGLSSTRAQLSAFNIVASKLGGTIGSNLIVPLANAARVAANAGVPITGLLGKVVSLGTKMAGVGGVAPSAVSVATAIRLVGIAAAAATGAVVSLTVAMVSLAKIGNELNVAFANIEQTFGKSSSVIMNAADEMAQKWGVSRTEFLRYADALGQIFQRQGIPEEGAAKMAADLTKGARERAKARGTDFESEFKAVQHAMAGGGNLFNEEQVATKAMQLGARPGGTLTEQMRQTARYHLAMEILNRDQQIAANASSTLGDELAQLWGHITNVASAIGSILAPPFIGLLKIVNTAAWGVEMLVGVLTQFVDVITGPFRAAFRMIFGGPEDTDEISSRNEERRQRVEQETATGQYLGGSKGGRGSSGYQGGLEGFAQKIQSVMFSDRTPFLLKKQNELAAKSLEELKKISDAVGDKGMVPAAPGGWF